MFNFYKTFVLLFFSFFVFACSNNGITSNTKTTISFKQMSSAITEGASLTYSLQLNKASVVDVSFDWSVQHSSTSVNDFTGALAGVQMIRAGSTTADITIYTSDDSIYEGDESFSVNITNIRGVSSISLSAGGSIIDNESQPAISFERAARSALENTSLVYRLRLTHTSTTDVTFGWLVQHSSTSVNDFTGALAGVQMIRAGSTTADITIYTSDDSIYEGNEIFILNITNVTGAVPDALVASGSIIDNDPQPAISFERAASAALEGTNFSYTLQLTYTSTTDVAFDWSVQHSSTSVNDFTGALAGVRLIRAGSTTADITIYTSDDSIYEGNEIFSLNVTNVTGAVPDALVASGSIIDNDPQPAISFERLASAVTEGTRLTYSLQLNKASAVDVSFDWSVQHSSTSVNDFTGALAGVQMIRAGSTTADITIYTSDDSIYEGNEIFSLNVTNVTGAVPDALVASGSIIDNDTQPAISFERAASAALEGTNFSYTLRLTHTSTTDVIFGWSVQHSSTSVNDFTGALAGVLMIRAGSTTADITIYTSDDSIYEGDEIFILNVTNVVTNVTGAVPDALVASGSIIDNDPQPAISFERAASAVTEGMRLTYSLQLNKASAVDVSFDWSVQHSSTSVNDFTGALAGVQMIRAGSTTADITIYTSDDSIYEGNEIFSLNVTNVTGAVPDALVASGSIIDNDPQPAISFERLASAVTEGMRLTYSLQLNKASAVNVSFDWSVQHSSTSVNDFTGALAGVLMIRAGSTTADITIYTSDDSIYEGDEIFSLNVTNVTGAVPDALVASGSIIDNDTQPAISFERVASAVTEGTNFSYTLRLTHTSTTDVTFGWSVQHSSTSVNDFTGALAGVQMIRAGSTTADITIYTSDDSIYEGDEIFSLNVTNVTGAVPDALVASGSIIDNDTQPAISFERVASAVTEGTNFSYTLRLTHTSTTDVTFGWSVQHSSTSVNDFTGALAGVLMIRAGSTTADITIYTSDDSIYEGDEIFSLNVTNVTGAVPDALVASGSIIDTDPQPAISFERVASAVTEGTNFSYTLRLTHTSTTDVTFDWSVQHSSTSVNDFTGALAGVLMIRAGSTTADITIYTSDDSIYEGNEIFSLNVTNVTGAVPDALVASGSIIDNDAQPAISFERAASAVTEGTRLTYSLQLDKASAVDVSFDWSVQHSSTSVNDFTGTTFGAKTIFAGDTTVTVELQINDDRRPEQAETFVLSITNITGATPDSLSRLIAILANDLDSTVDYNGNGLIDITTKEQLHNIRYNLAGTSYKTSTSGAGKTCGGGDCRGYELLANIALRTNWQPIGSVSNPFTSVLQGNGYSIANLAISGSDYLGLFAALSGATIDNLIVEVASIIGNANVGTLAGRAEQSTISRVQIRAVDVNSKLQATGARVGGMLGEIIDVTITNVTSDLDVVGGNNENAGNVGGIVGYVSSSDISYAYSSGSVFASGGTDNVGGLVGELTNSTISYSSSSSSVSSRGTRNYAYGGLVGYMNTNSDIHYSSASGSVTSSGDRNANHGGLVGRQSASSDISYSSASGSVSSSGDRNYYYGGLVGRIDSNSTISDSSTSASVTSNGYNNSVYGGLVGHMNNSTISYSSASASVSSTGDNSNKYGGLAGEVHGASKISNSSASGSVSSSGDNSEHYGGLVGELTNSTISYSSARGSVISSGDDNRDYGSLVGHMSTGSDLSYSSASGSVTSNGDYNYYYGGLVGEVESNSTISYSSASSNVTSNGDNNRDYGGLVGHMSTSSDLSYSSASGSVSSNGDSNWDYGGLVGRSINSDIGDSSASNSVISSGDDNRDYGGLVGHMSTGSDLSYSSASGSVTSSGVDNRDYGGLVGRSINSDIGDSSASGSVSSNGDSNWAYGGLVGEVSTGSDLSYSSASGSVTSSGDYNRNYGGLVGEVSVSSNFSYSSASGSVSSNGDFNLAYGGLVGKIRSNSTISHSNTSGSVSSNGDSNWNYGGLVGEVSTSSDLSYSSASGSVTSSGVNNRAYGGLVGMSINSDIGDSSASGSISSSGNTNSRYGGLVGEMNNNSTISYSSASGSLTSEGDKNWAYGGLVGKSSNSNVSYSSASGSLTSNGVHNSNYGGLAGRIASNSTISYSSASVNISSSGVSSDRYGGLVGSVKTGSTINYSSASGSVVSNRYDNDSYGGLVGQSSGEVQHSWSSSSVFANSAAGLVGHNSGDLNFSYALGVASYGLVNTNTGSITNSYWNSETSGALEAATVDAISYTTNIASSDTASMLTSTGFANARIFKGFATATDEFGRNIWSFADGRYPIITQLGVDSQAGALAYGLLRLAHPALTSGLNSFLGSTFNHEAITLDAINYNANEPLAILDINLLQSNSATCSAGSIGSVITTTGANQATVTLSITAATNNLQERVVYTDCNIAFDGAATISAGDRLQLAAIITKGSAILTKNFVINFQ